MRGRGVSLARYALRRLFLVLPFAAALILVSFLLIHLAPGDPLLFLAGDGGTPEYYADMRAYYGLDQSLGAQLARYAGAVLQGNLGHSFSFQQPVVSVLAHRVPPSLLLGAAALLIGVVLGMALGLLAVRRPDGILDNAVRLWTSVAYATPVFWLAQWLLLVLAVRFTLFPVGGMTSTRAGGQSAISDVLWHLALPALALGVSLTAVTARVARASLVEASRSPWVRAARARGVSASRLLLAHILPNAVIPVVTVVGYHAGSILSGAALTEAVFAWPGLGQLLLDASLHRDIPLAMGVLMTGMLVVVLANVVTDVAYRVLDPRMEIS